MNEKKLSRFIDELVSVIRRNRALTSALRGLCAGLFLLFINNIFTGNTRGITPYLLLLFLTGGALLGYFWPVDTKKILSITDHRAHLRQKLITTWEYMQDKPEHPLLILLKSDTFQELKKLNPRELFPVNLFPELPLCIIMGFLVIIFIPQGGLHNPYSAGQGVEEDLHRLEEIARELTQESLKPEFRDLSRLGEQMAEFAEALESGEDSDGLSTRHSELTDKLLQEQMKTREALERRLSSDTADRQRKTGESSTATGERDQFSDELRESRARMKDLYEEDMYGVPEKDQLGMLDDALGIMENLAGFYGSDRSPERGEEAEDLAPGGGSNGEEGEELDEDRPAPSSAGTFADDSPASGEEQVPEPDERQEVQMAGTPPAEDSFISVYIDDLHPPEEGEAYEDWEERMISYRSMLLNQLSREQIPSEHRELIQTYFSLLTAE